MVARAWDLSRLHPASVLLLLVGLFLVMQGLAGAVATAGATVMWGISAEQLMSALEHGAQDPHTQAFTLLVQVLSQVMGFALVAWFISEGYPSSQGVLGLSVKPSYKAMGVAFVWILVSQPLFTALTFDANSFELPEFLRGVERWGEDMEQQVADQLKMILGVPLLLNLAILAVVPAVCEELLFRGLMLSVLRRWMGQHFAVWVQGIVFSLLHLQPYGFLPRMLMGVAFGYLRISSGSLYPAMLAHFLNNALAVGLLYMNGEAAFDPSSDPFEGMDFLWVVVSGVLAVGLLVWLYQQRSEAIRSAPDPTRHPQVSGLEERNGEDLNV